MKYFTIALLITLRSNGSNGSNENENERSNRGLRNETEKLRFVTLAIATNFFAKYNQLIRVDTDKE